MSGLGLGLGLGLGAHRKVGARLDPATVAYIDRVLSIQNAQIKNIELTDSFIRTLRTAGLLDGASKILGAYRQILAYFHLPIILAMVK
jgi:hypothetical protein